MNSALFQTLLRFAVFLAGAYFSFKKMDGYWFVGPIFGAVVLFWEWSLKRKIDLVKAAAFFAASTLIWALVYRISKFDMPKIEKLFDSVYFAVMVGSLLMPAAYKIFFGAPQKRVLTAAVGIFLIFYISSLLFSELRGPASDIINVVTFWQGAYLFFLCSPNAGVFKKSENS